jgi:hypothetical protein
MAWGHAARQRSPINPLTARVRCVRGSFRQRMGRAIALYWIERAMSTARHHLAGPGGGETYRTAGGTTLVLWPLVTTRPSMSRPLK